MSKDHKPKHAAAKPAADKYITISVAEYMCLIKAATMLEVITNDLTLYGNTMEAVKATIQDMRQLAEEGAAL